MDIIASIANFFRSAPPTPASNQYGILSPLLLLDGKIKETQSLIQVLQAGPSVAALKAGKALTPHATKAQSAYLDFRRALSGQDAAKEKAKPLSVVMESLTVILKNLEEVENRFQSVFGAEGGTIPPEKMKLSAVLVSGFLEKADQLSTWVGNLGDHLTAATDDLIPPFRTQELHAAAPEVAEFVSMVLHKYGSSHKTILDDVRDLQKKGADVQLQSDGTWLDEYAHPNQYNSSESEYFVAGMRNPIMMIVALGHARAQEKIELMTARKEWLTAKVVMESAKLRGLDPASPEYASLKKTVDFYSNAVSAIERKIGRLRG